MPDEIFKISIIQLQEDKLEQNEELANLRADTSLEKQEMANEAREKLAMMKPRPNGRN